MMDIRSLKEFLGCDYASVQECIKSSLQSDIDLLNATNGSILTNSGKQLRPLLALLVARACSPDHSLSETSIRYAAASELLHNATLLHDDVADDSDQRRGAPTVNSLMGPTVSVLVGDYWLVKAMELIVNDSVLNSHVVKLFSKTLSDLAEGEMLQLQKAQLGDTDESDYLRIIYNKTASLFEAACVSAAMSVGASEEKVEAARKYSVALGIAFQIKDDILDYVGTESVGKPLGVDILEQKITMPLLGALMRVDEAESDEIRGFVRDIAAHPEHRDRIVSFVLEHDGVGYAKARLEEYIATATEALSVLDDSTEKDYLISLAHYNALRNK